MAGAAARSNAGGDRDHASLRAVPGQAVEIGGGGGFERREIILFLGGDVAQSIQDEQCQFGVCFDGQMRIEMIQVHIFGAYARLNNGDKAPGASSGMGCDKLPEHFVGGEAANPDRLVARGLAADDLDRAARAAEFFGQQINQSLIGGGIHRRRGHFDFQLPSQRAADFIFRRARLEFYRQMDSVGPGL